MKATYQKGTICYRCGILKKDARSVGCFRADRHIWNTKKLTLVRAVEAKKYVFERPKDDYVPETYQWLKAKNEARDEIIALLHSPEKK